MCLLFFSGDFCFLLYINLRRARAINILAVRKYKDHSGIHSNSQTVLIFSYSRPGGTGEETGYLLPCLSSWLIGPFLCRILRKNRGLDCVFQGGPLPWMCWGFEISFAGSLLFWGPSGVYGYIVGCENSWAGVFAVLGTPAGVYVQGVCVSKWVWWESCGWWYYS